MVLILIVYGFILSFKTYESRDILFFSNTTTSNLIINKIPEHFRRPPRKFSDGLNLWDLQSTDLSLVSPPLHFSGRLTPRYLLRGTEKSRGRKLNFPKCFDTRRVHRWDGRDLCHDVVEEWVWLKKKVHSYGERWPKVRLVNHGKTKKWTSDQYIQIPI